MLTGLLDRLTALSFRVKLLAAFAAGLVMVPAMPPYGLWPLLFIGFGVFYVLLAPLSGWRAFFAGWAFGFGYFAYGLYWIANALLVPGNDYAWVYPFAIAGLPALLACFTALAAWGARRYGGDAAHWTGYVIFCCAFGLMEWARGYVFTGYPWNLYGYAWASFLPVAQVVAVGGIYMLTLLTILWAALPAYALMARSGRLLLLGLVGFGVIVAAGAVRMELNPTVLRDDIVVRAVQPNIAQEDKWNPRKSVQNFERHLLLSQASATNADKTTILIWPETAMPFYILNDPSSRAALKMILDDYELPVYLFAGLLRSELPPGARAEDAQYYNSLVVLNREADLLGVYDKARLVPFGEYIPFQKFLPFGPFAHFAGFEAGDGPRTMGVQSLPSFSPLICYEIIFPGGAVDRDGARPEWLVNITNDAWYGDSMGPRQHFTMAVFRAIEQGLPAVRAANTGISGVIDPLGRVIHRAAIFTENSNDTPLPAPLARHTLFYRFGDSLFIMLWLLLAGGVFWRRRVFS